MTVIAIGKNSFLAKNIARHPASKDWVFLARDEIEQQQELIRTAKAVINFAFDPALSFEGYSESKDIDSAIAGMISQSCCYIMLSTRMVYGEMNDKNHCFSETDLCSPITPYGKNKKIIEDKLLSTLPNGNLTILRLSNVFGLEKGRKTFFGIAMKTLQEDNLMKFDISSTSRRDFLPVKNFCDALVKISEKPRGGIYNLGSGVTVTCGDIAQWLIVGYGKGNAIFGDENNTKGAFCLNTTKAFTDFSITPLSREYIMAETISCGNLLAAG